MLVVTLLVHIVLFVHMGLCPAGVVPKWVQVRAGGCPQGTGDLQKGGGGGCTLPTGMVPKFPCGEFCPQRGGGGAVHNGGNFLTCAMLIPPIFTNA